MWSVLLNWMNMQYRSNNSDNSNGEISKLTTIWKLAGKQVVKWKWIYFDSLIHKIIERKLQDTNKYIKIRESSPKKKYNSIIEWRMLRFMVEPHLRTRIWTHSQKWHHKQINWKNGFINRCACADALGTAAVIKCKRIEIGINFVLLSQSVFYFIYVYCCCFCFQFLFLMCRLEFIVQQDAMIETLICM